jgi:hypothetical protein
MKTNKITLAFLFGMFFVISFVTATAQTGDLKFYEPKISFDHNKGEVTTYFQYVSTDYTKTYQYVIKFLFKWKTSDGYETTRSKWVSVYTSPFKSTATVNYLLYSPNPLSEGEHEVTVTLDYLNNVTESDETNNIAVKKYCVKEIPTDVDGNGYVNDWDVNRVREKFGASIETTTPFPERCDVTHDGYVGIDDLFTVAVDLGKKGIPFEC